MATVVQDAADVLREVVKLSKEIAPVKKALAALYKREEAHEDPAAAAASLDKIAARVDKVLATYQPTIEAAEDMTMSDLPNFLNQVSLLRAGHEPAPETAEARRGAGAGVSTSFTDVCPENTPFRLQPEDYRCLRHQIELRVDMVNYLVVTGRVAFARHVAESYGLPLLWFPELHQDRLLSLQERRRATRSRTLADTIPLCAASSPCTAAFPASDASHPALTPLKPPMSPMLLSGRVSADGSPDGASPAPLFSISGVADDVVGQNDSSVSTFMGPPSRPVSRGTLRGLTKRTKAATTTATKAAAVAAERSTADARDASCNLLLRVLASAVYMKDDYIDRLILERFVDEPRITAKAKPDAAATAAVPNSTCMRCLHHAPTDALVSPRSGPCSFSSPSEEASPAGPGSFGSTPSAPPPGPTMSSLMPSRQQSPVTMAMPAAQDTVTAVPVEPVETEWQRADATREMMARVHTWPREAYRSTPTTPPVRPAQRTTHSSASSSPSRAADVVEAWLCLELLGISKEAASMLNLPTRPGLSWREVQQARAAAVPMSTLNTQSGSTQFDRAMMGLIEEVLDGALVGHDASQLRLPCSSPRTNGAEPESASHTAVSMATRGVLKAEGLLLADDAFTQQKVAIKRANRLFVAHTGTVAGGDPGDDVLTGGVNVVIAGATSAHGPTPVPSTGAVRQRVFATPNGSVWTGEGIQQERVFRKMGQADDMDDNERERRGDHPTRSFLRVQSLLGVPSADENTVYGVGTLTRLFIS